MTHVTCRLTAKNRDQLRNPTLGNRVWATFAFYCCLLLRHQLRLEDVVQHVDQISIIIFFLILCGGLLIVYNSLIHVVTVVLAVRFLFVLEVKFAVNLQFVNLTMPISL